MAEIRIRGGRKLCGEVWIQGSKNAALPIIAATVLHPGVTVLENVPGISDVEASADIIRHLGGEAEWNKGKLVLNTGFLMQREIPGELGERMRSSVLFLGALLGRFGEGCISRPGGCAIGARPVDLHLKGLEQLGAKIDDQGGMIRACLEKDDRIGEENRLNKSEKNTGREGDAAANMIRLDYPSVGATEQILLTASVLSTETVISGCAREPEIVSLCDFLRSMGAAEICGAGTDTIRIKGGGKTRDICFSVPGDRIAAGTYLAAGAITAGDVCVQGVNPEDMEDILDKFRCMGCQLEIGDSMIRLRGPKRLTAISFLETRPFPGFPTDMQSVFLALNAVSRGSGVIRENIFESRLGMANELNRMGAAIDIEGCQAHFRGVEKLYGGTVQGTDLRSGAGLILAGLAAEGETCIKGYEYVMRGYEKMEEQLRSLGAEIKS